MKKCSITLLILVFIFNCSQFVSGQATSDERQQSIILALSDAEADNEIKRTDFGYESEILDVKNDFYKNIYKDARRGDCVQTKHLNSQLEFLKKTTLNCRAENLTRKESAGLETVDVNVLKPDKFNFQPIVNLLKDTNKIFYYKKSEFSADTNLNAFNKQFYKKLPAHNFAGNGETDKSTVEDKPDDTDSSKKKEKFHWKPALIQSGIFLGIQHGFRIVQDKTRRELGGPFFQDWKNSVKNLRGWDDGNKLFTNYVAHPLQGGFTGRIFINNSDKAKKQELSKSKAYWESRFKAIAWATIWSTQFELGPISEASIGNVGIYDNTGRSKLSWGDLIVTPVFGTVVIIGEDAIDKYILKNWLERIAGYKITTKIKILRSLLTPTTSLANLLRGKVPWKRDNRLTYQIQTADK